MNRLETTLFAVCLFCAGPAPAQVRIWPDPGLECRPVRLVLGSDSQQKVLKVAPSKVLNVPASLSIVNPALDTPARAKLRMRVAGTEDWQDCRYDRGAGAESGKYFRTSCTGPIVPFHVDSIEITAALPVGETSIHVAVNEEAPCLNSPRSDNGLTVSQGGKFFPMVGTTNKWVAVLDEIYVSGPSLEQYAADLASAYGVQIDTLIGGPFAFTFFGSPSKAKQLSSHYLVRFVQREIVYTGTGYVDSVLPFPGGLNSWALDRLDQRESILETQNYNGSDDRYRFPERNNLLDERPRVFVVDNAPLATHSAFSGLDIVRPAIPGLPAQCSVGQGGSAHGTQSLGMLVGTAGIVRLPPQQTVAVAALGSGSASCIAGTESQIVRGLLEVQRVAEAGDILSLSFGSNQVGMMLEMKVNELSELGLVVFAATGNALGQPVLSPASATGVLAVGGLDESGNDQLWVGLPGQGSSGSPGEVDFYGPADEVPAPNDSSPFAIATTFGTSLATPLVAGLGYYQVVTSSLSGVTTADFRSRIAERLRATATIRTANQVVVPFTPTRPLFDSPEPVPNGALLLASTASDGSGTWLVGKRTSDASILRVPTGTTASPTAPNLAATQVVFAGGENARCEAVAAGLENALVGCWSPALQGHLRSYRVDSQNDVTFAVEDGITTIGQHYPLAVAVDHLDGPTQISETTSVRTALQISLNGVNSIGNPVFGTQISLAVVRRGANQADTLVTVPLGLSGSAYSTNAALALNCHSNGDCDSYALLTRWDATGTVTNAVEFWRLKFSREAHLPVGAPSLVAERVDSGQFYNCHVSGWAYSLGLRAVAISVDNADSSQGNSRWSFVYNREATGFWGMSCGFDSSVRVATQASGPDVAVGRRGESWSSPSRGAFSRSSLVVSSVWDPGIHDFQTEFRSTIRTLHPRDRAPAVLNFRRVQHSLYGDDAIGLYSPDGEHWSIARVRP